MKTVYEFEREIFEVVRVRRYIEMPPALHERGIATVKLRFRIKNIPDGFLQFYYNEANGKLSLVFIIKGARIYGHDYTSADGWHRHLFLHGAHDYSEEGKKPVTVSDFMNRVDGILRDK